MLILVNINQETIILEEILDFTFSNRNISALFW